MKGFGMISKELAKEVLYSDLEMGVQENGNNVTYYTKVERAIHRNLEYVNNKNGLFIVSSINIHELAHKCKEWAWQNDFYYWYENNNLCVKEIRSCKVDYFVDIGIYMKPFDIEIDFKACQWILNNK